MATIAVKGSGVYHYFKPGFNIVRRHMRGDEPDDALDLFEPLGFSKTKREADKKAKKFTGDIEVVKYKKPKDDL